MASETAAAPFLSSVMAGRLRIYLIRKTSKEKNLSKPTEQFRELQVTELEERVEIGSF